MKNYFTDEELSCPCCGINKFNPKTLARINKVREILGFALPASSGYRCKKYNELKGYTQTHSTGQAIDIVIDRNRAYKLLKVAMNEGFTGVGVKQKGVKRFIHLDDLKQEIGRPRETIWSY